jgi:putative ATPase
MKQPLALRMRPTSLNELEGQQHLFQKDGVFSRLVNENQLFSMIFYGPSGSGKTSAAHVLVKLLNRPFGMFNAATNNKKQLDQLLNIASTSNGYVLIMDEVHRLNKDKQDHLLPFIEDGTITLIGATTANPFFAINPAIRSRAHLIEFKALTSEDLTNLLHRAISSPKGLDNSVSVDDDVLNLIINMSNGDVRVALNLLEMAAFLSPSQHITKHDIQDMMPSLATSGFKDDDGYYDLLSAFQKSIRGSDVDASVYYLARLIQIGDLESLTRRLLVTAYEDIGLANPAAISRVVQAVDTAFRVGLPEARIPLSVAVIEMAASPKSKSANIAVDRALHMLSNKTDPIPLHLRLTPINLSKEDQYPYDRPDLWPFIGYLPESIKSTRFYLPSNLSAYEKIIYDNVETTKKYKKYYQISKIKKDKLE